MSFEIRINGVKPNEINLYVNDVSQTVSNNTLKKRSDLIPQLYTNINIEQIKITNDIQAPYPIGTTIKYNLKANELKLNSVFYICTSNGDKYIYKITDIDRDSVTFAINNDSESIQLAKEDIHAAYQVINLKWYNHINRIEKTIWN